MATGKLKVIDWILCNKGNIPKQEIGSFPDWKNCFDKERKKWSSTIDRAVVGGFLSDRVAYAFGGGYQSALQYLFPQMGESKYGALCITEEGGGHPNAVKTTISEKGTSWIINGKKQFITMADIADVLFIAVSTGFNEKGRNKLKVAVVSTDISGVIINHMPDLKFIPEIKHGTVSLDNVIINRTDVLDGDGFSNYVRPFRTIEDCHITAAIAGYLFKMALANMWENSFIEEMASVIASLSSIIEDDPSLPNVHIALGGLMRQFNRLIEDSHSLFDTLDSDSKIMWNRDKKLLSVAAGVRERRLVKAWENY